MKISFKKVMLKKRFPLAISRGISGDNHNVFIKIEDEGLVCLLYTSPSPRDATLSRMPSSA